MDNQPLVYRLNKRAEIRRQISTRKSVQEGKPDRIADLLEEAAIEIKRLKVLINRLYEQINVNEDDTKSEKEKVFDFIQRCGIDLNWTNVDPSQWSHVLYSVKGLTPDLNSSNSSLHCYNEVYVVDDKIFNIIYENGHKDPIDIKVKNNV